MGSIQFQPDLVRTSHSYSDDDLYPCLRDNNPDTFRVEDILEIVAEVPGHNDGDAWWWILKLGEERYVCLSARCDYTGWDCISSIDFEGESTSALDAVELSPEREESTGRQIRKNLVAQILDEQPFGLEICESTSVGNTD